MEGEAEWVAPSERPALAQLTNSTDVDDATNEHAAESTCDESTADNASPATASTAADDQQVNSEDPATRLVYAERSSQRHYAQP